MEIGVDTALFTGHLDIPSLARIHQRKLCAF
jgi:hypothetical protein